MRPAIFQSVIIINSAIAGLFCFWCSGANATDAVELSAVETSVVFGICACDETVISAYDTDGVFPNSLTRSSEFVDFQFIQSEASDPLGSFGKAFLFLFSGNSPPPFHV